MTGSFCRRSTKRLNVLAILVIGMVSMLTSATAHATNYTVDTIKDSSGAGDCSLRDAIMAANRMPVKGSSCGSSGSGSDTIGFGLTGTIMLGSRLPAVTDQGLRLDLPIRLTDIPRPDLAATLCPTRAQPLLICDRCQNVDEIVVAIMQILRHDESWTLCGKYARELPVGFSVA